MRFVTSRMPVVTAATPSHRRAVIASLKDKLLNTIPKNGAAKLNIDRLPGLWYCSSVVHTTKHSNRDDHDSLC